MRFFRLAAKVLPAVVALAGMAVLSGQSVLATGGELLPDLKALPPRDMEIVKVRSGKNIETRLRFDTRVANEGSGPLELYPVSQDCDGDGNARNDRTAYQRIFQDSNSSGAFERGTDLLSRAEPVGCMIFHPQHHHWHIKGFATYALKAIGTDGAVGPTVAASEKVSFCMLDMEWLGDPADRPAEYYTECGRNATMGISVNWADEYYSTLAGQYIPITGVPDGDYCLVNVADPEGDETALVESIDTNNAAGVKITISGNGTAVSPRDLNGGLAEPCGS